MRFALSKEDFKIFKKFLNAFKHIKDLETTDYEIRFSVDDNDMEDFSVDMTFDIIDFGMDNQDTVNNLGVEMYRIHDCLMYSENGSKYRPL